ncbi:MAG TPA: hypothetical protein VHI93_07105 [Candidatus Thermoplasmatota archaeon]|nr:hypothetical protein [Candidatus Thermoplasmatota archaeon]
MGRAARRTGLAACLVVLAGTRAPAEEPWTAAVATVLAALLGVATLAPPASAPSRRLRGAILPATVGLAVLPGGTEALLAVVPWPVTAALTVVFLHLAFPAEVPPAPSASPIRGSALRWLLPGSLLAVAAVAPLLVPLALPAPLAALQELRPLGGILVVALVLTLVLVGAGALLRGSRTGADEPARRGGGAP